MKASETEFKKIIEGTSQFFVPHYQRPYSWDKKHWQQLWDDLVALVDERASDTHDGPKPTHFIGSMVTAPGSSVPQGIAKYVLIDGQQRVTTLMILLTVLRDLFREREIQRQADMIHNLYLTNQYQEADDHYKLLPTQGEAPETSDRTAFIRLVIPSQGDKVMGHRATSAYEHFGRKIRSRSAPDPVALLDAITSGLLLVSIVLDRDDNPYTIFESLNAKGRSLSEADLIRNFFFMRIDQKEHERAYHELWRPMEKILAHTNMTEFFRQYLMRGGTSVRSDRVYMELKQTVERRRTRSPLETLREIHRYATHFAAITDPQRESHAKVCHALTNLQRLNFGVTYSFLLNLYDDYSGGRIEPDVMVQALTVLENYLLRRYVCGIPSNALNKIFPVLYRESREEGRFSLDRMKAILGEKGYPSDEDFLRKLAERRLYGGGDRREKAKFILDRIESSFGHKEKVDTSTLTIEHVMPQTLTTSWRGVLGEDADELHDIHLHRLGNLTLTAYNSDLSNAAYAEKRPKLAESHVELNKYFFGCERWDFTTIEVRSRALADRGLAIWPNFRPNRESRTRARSVITGTKPRVLFIGDRRVEVKDWSEVLSETMKFLCDNHSDSFPSIEEEFDKCVAENASSLRTPRPLRNGYHYEANMSAQRIYKICEQIMDFVGNSEEWRVETRS